MSIKVDYISLGPDDPLVTPTSGRGGAPRRFFPHSLFLATSSYAYLAPDSSKEFIIRPCSAGSLGIVIHCQETRRTTVSDVRSAGDWNSFEQHLRFVSDGKKTSVQVLVISSPLHPPSATFQPAFLALAASLELALTFAFTLPSIAFRVQRTTAHTTLMYLSPSTMIDPMAITDARSKQRLDFEQRWEMLAGFDSSTQEALGTLTDTPRWQYGPQEWSPRLPVLSDGLRTLLREAWESRMLSDTSRAGISPGAKDSARRMMEQVERDPACDFQLDGLQMFAKAAVDRGAWCSVCGVSTGLKQCGACGWEYYCSTAHQQQDWPHHKSWCKTNRK